MHWGTVLVSWGDISFAVGGIKESGNGENISIASGRWTAD